MEDEKRRVGLGRIISALGIAWLALFFLAGTGLFGSSQFSAAFRQIPLFLPIAMMFVGRVIRRRATRKPVEEIESTPPRPSPQPARRPPVAVTKEELTEAVTLEEVESSPKPDPKPIVSLPDVEGLSSAEMVAEAKKRLSS